MGNDETSDVEGPDESNAIDSVGEEGKFESILKKENIKTDLDLANKEEIFRYLARMAVNLGYASDEQKLIEKYYFRELQSSTGMEKGIAIPHAQDVTINQAVMLVLKLRQTVEWESLDGKPIDTIISFLIPEKNSKEHLKFLAQTSALLMNEDFIKELQKAGNPQEIFNLFI